MEDAYKAASALKIVVDGKTTYKVPTEGDLTKLLVVCDEFHQAFVKLQKFIAEHDTKVRTSKRLQFMFRNRLVICELNFVHFVKSDPKVFRIFTY